MQTMIENNLFQLIVCVPTVQSDKLRLGKVPIAQKISNMLDIGQETFHDFPVDY